MNSLFENKADLVKISIVTINKNNAQGLEATIESVVSQSYPMIEYIVVDGNSKDSSSALIEKYKSNISVVIQEEDDGIYDAMNKAIARSSGDYLLFLNSGDYLAKLDVIELMFQAPPDDIKFLYGNLLKNYGDRLELHKGYQGKEINIDDLVKGSLFHPATFINKSVFEKYGFYDTDLKIVSDWKLFLLAVGLNCESTAYRDVAVSCFDMYGISNQKKEAALKERAQVLKSLGVDLSSNKQSSEHNDAKIGWMKRLVMFVFER